jgi:PmbA protein
MGAEERDAAGIFALARARGARVSEVLLAERTGHVAEAHRGRLLRSEPISSKSCVVRCWDERGAEGEASGPWEEASLVVDRAWAACAQARPGESEAPPDPSRVRLLKLGIDDRRFGALTVGDREEVLMEAEKAARNSDRRFRTEVFRYADERVRRTFASSRGGAVEEWSTSFALSGAVGWSAEPESLPVREVLSGRTFSSVAAIPMGAMLLERATALTGTAVRGEGPVRAWIPPRVVARWVDALAVACAQGCPWVAPYGSRWLNEAFTLIDDGTTSGALNAASFDDRGSPPSPVVLVRDGVRQTAYVVPGAARPRGVRLTGHAWGGRWRANALGVRPGSRSMAVILGVTEGPVLMVDDAEGSVDPQTGFFRGRLNGLWVEGGEPRGVVRNAVAEGLLSELCGAYTEISADSDRTGPVDAPGLLTSSLRVVR